jgi:hypothetical protein
VFSSPSVGVTTKLFTVGAAFFEAIQLDDTLLLGIVADSTVHLKM